MHPASPKPRPARPLALSSLLVCLCLAVAAPIAQADDLSDAQKLVRQKQLPQALAKIDAYLAVKPKDAQGRFTRGVILTEMGRSADAITVFQRLTEDYPELPEPYNNLAVLYAQQKQYEKARTALEMAIRTNPSYSVAHENLADVYAKLASQAYGKALQLESSNPGTPSQLAMLRDLNGATAKPAAAAPAQPAQPAQAPAASSITQPVVAGRSASGPVRVAAGEVASPPPVAEKPAAKAPLAEPAKTESVKTEATRTESAKAGDKAAEKKEDKAADKSGKVEADIERALRNWAAAWSRKDVRAYLASYAPDFQTPRGVSRKAWEAERTQRIDKPGKIEVMVEDVRISLNGDKATVRFRQSYKSATMKSSTGKTLVFVRSGGAWLIQQERVG
ncbi:tetratricopeptide repeat protein [Rhodocyclus purpureus]|uniref:nuclear transport factor 2 family protein n=1 Tax=Rhodocyclus purpureus TaxID=1067 RepID=UPI0019128C8A|nr:tetratricopeptide repeat protein [Rhodocyclus purpureus]MBK5913421.1 DUF4440 domain-containing protein [Rhodocyclus purpureus]